MMRVGYRLINIKTQQIVQEWGGVWGQCSEIPNPLILPNGDHVCAAKLGVDYAGHQLVEWTTTPPVHAVKAEAQRRIIEITGGGDLLGSLIRQINGVVSDSDKLRINAIRTRSNEVEAMIPIPSDYTADVWWE